MIDWYDDDPPEDEFDYDGYEPSCYTCCGEGVVDSVAQASGRYGWDDDGPGDCPNCGGSGLRKDQKVF